MGSAKPIWMIAGASLAWLVADRVVFAQCAMCKTGLLNSPEGQKLASGFNTGILFLLSVPILVVGALALLILNAHRRRERKHQSVLSERLAQPNSKTFVVG